jgi:hypothetical protein
MDGFAVLGLAAMVGGALIAARAIRRRRIEARLRRSLRVWVCSQYGGVAR